MGEGPQENAFEAFEAFGGTTGWLGLRRTFGTSRHSKSPPIDPEQLSVRVSYRAFELEHPSFISNPRPSCPLRFNPGPLALGHNNSPSRSRLCCCGFSSCYSRLRYFCLEASARGLLEGLPEPICDFKWRPSWMEGVRYQTQVNKILWEQFYAARRVASLSSGAAKDLKMAV
jgi:hypothetical protein